MEESVEKLNDKFLKANHNDFESLIEGSKILYDLNPKDNRKKALEILKNISKGNTSIKYENAIEALEVVAEKHYFGRCSSEEIENIRTTLKVFFPEATIFKNQDEQANELISCIQNLSISSFLSSVTDIAEKS